MPSQRHTATTHQAMTARRSPRATRSSTHLPRARRSFGSGATKPLFLLYLLLLLAPATHAHPGHDFAPVKPQPAVVDCSCLVGPASPTVLPSCLPTCCFACDANPVPAACLSALAEAACATPAEPSPDPEFDLVSSPAPDPLASAEPFASPDALTQPDPLPALAATPGATVMNGDDDDNDNDVDFERAETTTAPTTTTPSTTKAEDDKRVVSKDPKQEIDHTGRRPNAPDACACLLAEKKCRRPLALSSGACDPHTSAAEQPIFCKWTCCVMCISNEDAPPCPMQRFKTMCATVRKLVRQHPHLIATPDRW